MKKNSYYVYVLIMLLNTYSTTLVQAQITKINGVIFDSLNDKPLEGVTIRSGHQTVAISRAEGRFTIDVNVGDSIFFSFLGYRPYFHVAKDTKNKLTIGLIRADNQLEEVIINTGYQQLKRQQVTGSVDVVGQDLLNRSVSTDLLSRLENLTPGLLFNRGDAAATDPFLIRGRSSITADAKPLIVLDDFPYEGDLNNINPNDIFAVSILKDAAAASIWGARAGNGVIVLTSKKGQTEKLKIEIGSSVTIQGKPNLYNVNTISSADRIEWERLMFQQGKYKNYKNPVNPIYKSMAIPLAAELFIANPPDLEEQLESLKQHDVRDDLSRYFYQTSVRQQNSLNMSGMHDKLNYLFSGGYDHNLSNLVGASDNRYTLRTANTYAITPNLQLDASLTFTQDGQEEGNNNGLNSGYERYGLSPYARFADDSGHALPHYSLYRPGFLDTVGSGQLLDWNLRPLEEIHLRENKTRRTSYLVNLGGNYQIFPSLQVSLKYQYQQQLTANRDLYKENSFYARNEINRFTQINAVTGAKTYPIPVGGIMMANDHELQSHQGRFQLTYQQTFHEKHSIFLLGGYELRSGVTLGSAYQFYGYQEKYRSVSSAIDFVNPYPVNSGEGISYISQLQLVSQLTDHFLSAYFNGNYTYNDKYLLSGSFRKDEANLFGVSANQKGTPLWSVGASWMLHREAFFPAEQIPQLNLRVSYGINGNISRAASAYTTAIMSSEGQSHHFPTATIYTAPNKNLQWERVKQFNAGIDFSLWKNRVGGSIDYYIKNAGNLLAQAPIDPTLGLNMAFGNTAGMRSNGFDLQIHSENFKGSISWQSDWIYSYSVNKVTKYLMPVSTQGFTYAHGLYNINPIVGKPLYSAYSYAWAGLDPENGDPMFYLNGQISKDYYALYNAPLEQMQYSGPAQPTHYGAWRNTVRYGRFNLSFNISYKLGYYFRQPSVNNTDLRSNWGGHGDYALRWQKPGDELVTNVPSMLVLPDYYRDNAYTYASILMQKADVIRLEDINISYILPFCLDRKYPSKNLRIYLYGSNLGKLWAANTAGIDPYYNNIPSITKSIAIGANLTF